MKNTRYIEINRPKRRLSYSMWSLALPIVLGVYGAAGLTSAHAQETSGQIFGAAPAGESVTAKSTSGTHRHVKVNAKGRYSIGSVPAGVYTVALEKDGKAVETRSNIPVTVGRGSEIDFACAQDQCAESAGN